MPFNLIKGTFHVIGYSPDGDSIRFQADDRDNWKLLAGPPVQLNAKGHAQLRIEAIDTLETHYQGHHQPLQLANAAMHFLLDELGIRKVKFNDAGTRIVSAEDGTAGYILSRTTEKNRRPVSFVFAGAAEESDGAPVFLDPGRLKYSINYQSVLAGLAYPTYYSGLFSDLRKTITRAADKARKGGKGIWPKDQTTHGFTVVSLASVTDDEVILPKLFRRIINFMGDGGGIDGFKDYLAANPEPVLELKAGHFSNLDTFVEVTRNKVRLTVEPEDLVFVEK
ncbi:hypothetical protein [Methylomicrobium sp. Wu6]|uniref:hypothetical protein n=1 Tax=Methylomicrobium sp. Wu6 TaxID=3107928 RepID=UPI002DD6B68C|nr:hypothetical protein [Methylomicrobium sp. Wu6]MEC4748959.1 hypothetical protein [Methylomicrobium sp. Wu6]